MGCIRGVCGGVYGFYVGDNKSESRTDGESDADDGEKIGFRAILEKAAIMGFNIQSDDFWELRPDNFIIMSRAYDIRQQQEWLPFRRLMSVIVASQGGKIPEEEFVSLPFFDKPKKKYIPIKLSKEEIEKIKERNKRVEKDKAWELSWTRRITVTIITYLLISVFLLIIRVDKPFISSIIPALAYIISTLSLDAVKNWWLKNM